MSRIINIKQAIALSKKLKSAGKAIVLTGGCFDVLHLGHIKFLEAAKKRGDYLFVFIESDEKSNIKVFYQTKCRQRNISDNGRAFDA